MTCDPNAPLNCPACGVSLLGDPIPADQRQYFAGTRFKREIGLYDMNRDRTIALKCPDCGHTWKR